MENSSSAKVRYLFGTDGVRDVANTGNMTPEMALGLGRAFALFLTEKGTPCPRIVVGRDTRKSGQMLESALIAGMLSAGAHVRLVGVFPTPGVSFVVRHFSAAGGAVISASHNPAEYNGIKFLDEQGQKLSDEDELAIEEYLAESLLDEWRPTGASIGEYQYCDDDRKAYIDWLSGCVEKAENTAWSLVVDAANGAAANLVESLFSAWPASTVLTGVTPDGININEEVGVTHLSHLCRLVKEKGASLGIAYDGDTDRVLFCDAHGREIDGDIVLWILARWLHKQNRLGKGVVVTVMSNLALEDRLAEEGIKVFRCPVGDRYVLETMKKESCRLGGEQSGHIIPLDFVATGDGLCTGFLFLRAAKELGEDIDTLVDRFGRLPQILRNLKVCDRVKVLESPLLTEAVGRAETLLAEKGRLLIRPSGTEPLIRILLESKDRSLIEKICDDLADTILQI